MNRVALLCAFTLSMYLCACSTKLSLPLPPGTGGSLTRNASSVLFVWDQFGATSRPMDVTSIHLDRSDDVKLSGWAINGDRKALASEVDLMVDGSIYKVSYGFPRPDVAAAYKQPALVNCGFSAAFPAETMGLGNHRIALRVMGEDKKSYYQSPDIAVSVK